MSLLGDRSGLLALSAYKFYQDFLLTSRGSDGVLASSGGRVRIERIRRGRDRFAPRAQQFSSGLGAVMPITAFVSDDIACQRLLKAHHLPRSQYVA
jgi:hypothetical protein